MPAASPSANPVQEAREKAVVLERVGRYREAAHCWHLVLADAPDDVDVLCHLAHNYQLVGEKWRAGEYIAQAVAADPNNEWAHRIHCSLVLGKGKESIAIAQKAVKLNPTGERAWYGLAQAHLLMGEVEKARAAALRLRELAPEWSASHETVAEVARKLGKLSFAEKEARTALALDAESFTGHLLLGRILFDDKRHQEAADSFVQALKLRPDSHRTRHGLVGCVLAARRTFRLLLNIIPFGIALTVCLCPALHFRLWQSCVIGFLAGTMVSVWQTMRNRVPLSPEVEAAYRAERAQMVKAVFRRARHLWEAVE